VQSCRLKRVHAAWRSIAHFIIINCARIRIFVWLYACVCGRYNNGQDCNTLCFSKRSYEEGTYLRIHTLPSRSSPSGEIPVFLLLYVLRLCAEEGSEMRSAAMCCISKERERKRERERERERERWPLARDFYKILYWYTSNRYRPLPLSPPLMPGNYWWDLSRFIPSDLKMYAFPELYSMSEKLATNIRALFFNVRELISQLCLNVT